MIVVRYIISIYMYFILFQTKQNVPVLSNVKDNVSSSKENLVLVVDTNIFIQELDFIKNIMNSHIKGNNVFYLFD